MQNTVFGGCARQWERGGGRENQYCGGGRSGRPAWEIVHVKAEKTGCVNTLCAHTPPKGFLGTHRSVCFSLKSSLVLERQGQGPSTPEQNG